MQLKFKHIPGLLKATVEEWNQDKASRLAAALAYYTIFSLAPLLIITIGIAGIVFGEDAARNQIAGQIQGLVGRQGAEAIQAMIANAGQHGSGVVATIVGIVTLLFGASGLFGQLQDALNTIWEVTPKPDRGLVGIVKDRFLSFSMVLGTGFLLLVSLVLSAGLAAFGTYFGHLMPGLAAFWQIVNFAVSFGVITLLFGLIYKTLPDVKITWNDVWIGATVTALLFTIGRYLIGLYLGSSAIGSSYGAAGSLVIVLVWVYYSAQILLFGAEFTQVYATRYGSRIVPTKNAIPVTQAQRQKQGIPKAQNREEIGDGTLEPQPSRTRPGKTVPQSPAYLRHGATVLGTIIALVGMAKRSTASRGDRPSRRH